MFSKPEYGWTKVSYKNIEMGSASYIFPILVPTLLACKKYLEVPYTNGFNLTFDAEDHEFGIVQIGCEFFYWSDGTDSCVPKLVCLTEDVYDTDRFFVKTLAKEIIQDIESDIDAWVRFELCADEDISEDELNETKQELLSLINEVKKLVTPSTKSKRRDMELGNILFGNSRGTYEVPREKWQDVFCEFLESCGFDSYGHLDNDALEKYLKTIDGTEKISLLNGDEYVEHTHVFDNGIFRIMPYWWGESENIKGMPNFIYYPTHYELQWYKYPLRDAWSNQNITLNEFQDILQKCKESLSI